MAETLALTEEGFSWEDGTGQKEATQTRTTVTLSNDFSTQAGSPNAVKLGNAWFASIKDGPGSVPTKNGYSSDTVYRRGGVLKIVGSGGARPELQSAANYSMSIASLLKKNLSTFSGKSTGNKYKKLIGTRLVL